MPFPHERHPDDLKDAIGQAILHGMKATELVRALEAGTFQHFGPYVIPLATARYYGQQARKKENAQGLTTRAKQGINEAVEAMAREILSEVDQELAKVRRASTRDLEKLGAIAKLLKECKALAPNAGPTQKAGRKQPVPADPFAAAIAGSVRAVPPPPKKKTQEPATQDVSTADPHETAEPDKAGNTSQVLSQAPWS